jgi:DNA-binding transcriptional LysR family regulator
MLNLARLLVFREVARCGSFSAAAGSLAYTQSAVSQSIARLEAEAGTQLLVRDRRGVRLTPAGSVLLGHAESILAQVGAAEEALASLLGLRGGRLRIASFPSAGATLIPRAVAAFRRLHPEVALTLVEGEPEEIAPRLGSGEIDLGLLFDFPSVPGSDPNRASAAAEPTGSSSPRFAEHLKITPLLEDPMHVALAAEHRLAARPRLSLADLRSEEWVQTSAQSPCARHVVRMCLAAGFTPRVSFESDDYETVQGLVASGVGVALIPRLALTRVHDGVVVRALSPTTPTRLVVAATAPAAAPAAGAMLAVLRRAATAYAGSRQALGPRRVERSPAAQ